MGDKDELGSNKIDVRINKSGYDEKNEKAE